MRRALSSSRRDRLERVAADERFDSARRGSACRATTRPSPAACRRAPRATAARRRRAGRAGSACIRARAPHRRAWRSPTAAVSPQAGSAFGQIERPRPGPGSVAASSLALVRGVRRQTAPALDRGLEFEEPAIEAGIGDRRRQIADQRRRRRGAWRSCPRTDCSTHRDRDWADRRSAGPASTRSDRPACLPGMNSSAPWVPKCSTACGAEILAQPAIEGREGVRRRRSPSRTTAASDRLRSRRQAGCRRRRCRTVRRARRIDAPSLCCLPGAGPHCASIWRSQFSRRTMVVGGDPGVHVGERAEARGIAADDRGRAAHRRSAGTSTVIAGALHRAERFGASDSNTERKPRCRYCRRSAEN